MRPKHDKGLAVAADNDEAPGASLEDALQQLGAEILGEPIPERLLRTLRSEGKVVSIKAQKRG